MPFAQWDKLLYGIERGECILFLGPEIEGEAADGSRVIPATGLARQLMQSLDPAHAASIDPQAGDLSWIAQRYIAQDGEIGLEMELTRWHDAWRERESEVHTQLAALPFRLVVTTSLDPLMKRALLENDKHPAVEHYNYRGRNEELLPVPTPRAPVLFHLYGHVDEPESVVLSELHLLDFLARLISRDPPLPRDLNAALTQGRLFLFLGFGLRQWHLRILFHVLRVLRSDSRGFAIEALDTDPAAAAAHPDPAILFYRDNFKIDYSQEDPLQFARELRRRFKESGGPQRVQAAASAREGGVAAPIVPAAQPKVFICHAHEDRDTAREIHDALTRAQLEPWLDQHALRGGDQWDNLIASTIDEVDYVIVVNSRALEAKSHAASYVNKEINRALEAQTARLGTSFIVPVLIDETPILRLLAKFHTIDLREPDGLRDLVRAVKREANRQVVAR